MGDMTRADLALWITLGLAIAVLGIILVAFFAPPRTI